MSLSSLECAPTDILREICDYLDCHSLIALALASRRCASLAQVCLFLMIHTGPFTRAGIQSDINFWIRSLERASGLKQDRRLRIDLSMLRDQDRRAKDLRNRFITDGCYPDDSLSDNDSVFSLMTATYPPQEAIDKDDATRSLVDFISQIPVLFVLSYACSNQFLQAASRQDCPSSECGLHVRSFKIRSLEKNDKSSHEITLATSPCSHSIRTGFSNIDSDRIRNYNEKAVFWAVSHLAPKPEEACIFYFKPDFPLRRHWVRLEIPWRGFIIAKPNTAGQPRALTKPELCRYSLITLNVAKTWGSLTNFAALRVLELSGTIEDKALRWLAACCRFRSLVTLFLYMDLDWAGNPATDEYQDLFSSFIRSLPPLKILKIVSSPYKGNLIPSILQHHGKSLRHLELQIFRSYKPFTFDPGLVGKIRHHCTELSYLKLGSESRYTWKN